MEGTGEVARAREPAGHKKEVQKRIASGEEMSETSPDSIAAMMARDAAEGNSEEGSEVRRAQRFCEAHHVEEGSEVRDEGATMCWGRLIE